MDLNKIVQDLIKNGLSPQISRILGDVFAQFRRESVVSKGDLDAVEARQETKWTIVNKDIAHAVERFEARVDHLEQKFELMKWIIMLLIAQISVTVAIMLPLILKIIQ